MSYTTEHKRKFDELKFSLDYKNRNQLRRKANGGNSILFSYPPEEEEKYINKAKELLDKKAEFIDISKFFVELIDLDGWENFEQYYHDFKETPYKIFQSNDPSQDLFDIIISAIEKANEENKIPLLIRTGVLFGTGIENSNIMEHKVVMNLATPLVIFYPSKLEGETLYFLNFKPASKYRCKHIN